MEKNRMQRNSVQNLATKDRVAVRRIFCSGISVGLLLWKGIISTFLLAIPVGIAFFAVSYALQYGLLTPGLKKATTNKHSQRYSLSLFVSACTFFTTVFIAIPKEMVIPYQVVFDGGLSFFCVMLTTLLCTRATIPKY